MWLKWESHVPVCDATNKGNSNHTDSQGRFLTLDPKYFQNFLTPAAHPPWTTSHHPFLCPRPRPAWAELFGSQEYIKNSNPLPANTPDQPVLLTTCALPKRAHRVSWKSQSANSRTCKKYSSQVQQLQHTSLCTNFQFCKSSQHGGCVATQHQRWSWKQSCQAPSTPTGPPCSTRPGRTYGDFQQLAPLHSVPALWLCPTADPGWLWPAPWASAHLHPGSGTPRTLHPLGPWRPPRFH